MMPPSAVEHLTLTVTGSSRQIVLAGGQIALPYRSVTHSLVCAVAWKDEINKKPANQKVQRQAIFL
jgi:hypothetical protein